MRTTVKINDTVITLESDSPEIVERLAKYAIELEARGRGPAADSTAWKLSSFVRRSLRHPSQIGLLRALVASENGQLARSEMVKAAGKKNGRELAGCRGSMSKNAIAANLPSDWWKTSWDRKKNEYAAILRADVHKALKAELLKP